MAEYCWDGNGWFVGEFKAEGVVTGATSWLNESGVIIKVYVRIHAGYIEEHTCENGWSVTSTFALGYFLK
ncbi:unnamed protein product [Blepharisma stoltei]|uniref:Uncharacterized protein n=1 Tax=Blepharisma stoltei TaxID=1481888 RepID=A0AAU9J101_9CILI|nr:unnamed protein product [Blepharisma stoltei]